MSRPTETGRAAEDLLVAVLRQRGYPVRQQVPIGKGIFGTELRADILVEAPGFEGGLIIESKWQGTSGSAEEKLPYLVQNIRERYPLPTVIVVAGGGMRNGALEWVRAQEGGRIERVFTNLDEFVLWVLRL